METFPTHEGAPSADAALTPLTMALAQLCRDQKAFGGELKELRALVMDLAPQERADLVQHVGKLTASLTMLQAQGQEQADRLTFLEKHLSELRAVVEPFQALRTLLATDPVAWDTVMSLVRSHDSWTQNKGVRNWVAAWCGRPLHMPTQ
jgi:hypothetical protein